MASFILNHLADIHWWNIADFIVGFLFVYLLFWGRSNKLFKKNEYNEDFLSLDTMKSLRGFAAIGVILHHISQQNYFQMNGILSPFVNAGAYFVAIFFFCSGYGLLKSYDSKPGYLKKFISKRIIKAIVLPFYIDVLLYGAFYAIVKIHLEKEQWIFNLTGLTMMNVYAWFPIVLTLLYLVFFLTFRFVRNRKVCFGIILGFILLMGIGTMIEGHCAWWTGPKNWWCSEYYYMNEAKWWMGEKIFWFHGEWWANSAPAFFTGLVFANYEKQIIAFFKKDYKKRFLILFGITELCFLLSDFGQTKFGYWTEFNLKGPEIGNKIATYFCQFPLLLILPVTVFIFLMKYHVSNPVTRFFGKYSLHTYLMNLMAIQCLNFLQMADESSPFYMGHAHNNLLANALAVIALTVALGVLEYKITDTVRGWIYKDKVKPAPAPYTRISLLAEENDVYARKMNMFRGDLAGDDKTPLESQKAAEKAEEKKAEKAEKTDKTEKTAKTEKAEQPAKKNAPARNQSKSNQNKKKSNKKRK